MMKLQLGDIRSVLCLGCHADDIEIGCGGTLLRLLAENPQVDVHWVVLSGEATRADEARASAERYLQNAASSEVIVKGFRDSYFPYQGAEVKDYIHEISRAVSPDLILTHHGADMHQDHRLVAELTRNAFRDHLILEYEIPKYDGDLGRPNVYVPLDEAVCRSKVRALMDAFPTQRAKPWFAEDTFWSLMRIRGVECHSESRYAEAFHCPKLTL